MSFAYACMVPGLPHILNTHLHPSYKSMVSAMEEIGDELQKRGIQRIVYASTQWISVLGYSVQGRSRLAGKHVDENWHDLDSATFEYDIAVDQSLSRNIANTLNQADLQTKLIDYHGFPIDTGTLLANKLINKKGLKTCMVSLCVYGDFAETEKVFSLVKETVNDGTPTALVIISGLSGRYFTHEIDLREDRISSPSDDAQNKAVIKFLEEGKFENVPDNYAAQCKVDLGFKVLPILKASGFAQFKCRAYGPIYGTGACVLSV